MNPANFKRFSTITVLVAGILFWATQPSVAQQKTDALVFGSPLKNDIVFFYKYTEKVNHWFLDKDGKVQDTSERVLTYYISERQLNAEIGGGTKTIEANIDSMHVDYRGRAGNIEFNTQSIDDVNDLQLVRHSAVLVPSALVNCVAQLTLSPYGTLVGMKSKSFDNVREQGEDPMLDDFVQKRIEHMVTPEFLSTILFPWRNVVPLGRIVAFGGSTSVQMTTTLDRVVFIDTATVVLEHSESNPTQGVIDFKANLANSTTEWVTFEGEENPVLLSGAEGFIAGKLTVDNDGLVLSGWSMANGTLQGSARGKNMNVRVQHQVSVELLDQKSFPGN